MVRSRKKRVYAFCSSLELRTLVAKTAAPGKMPRMGLRQRSEHQASQPPAAQKMTHPRNRKRELSTVWVLPVIELSQVSGGGTPRGLPGCEAWSAAALK